MLFIDATFSNVITAFVSEALNVFFSIYTQTAGV